MTNMRYLPIVLTIFVLTAANSAYAASVEVLTPKIRAGETLIVKLNEEPKNIRFNDVTITAFPYKDGWRAIVPLSLSTKTGAYRLTVELRNGQNVERTITVSKKSAKTIVLPPPPKLGMTAQEITKNLAVANSAVRKVTQEIQDITRFNQSFGLALADNRKISSPFGEVRITGEESITHLGTDFDASRGRAVAAINAGVVKNAYLDPIYGNSVIVDHGRGIYSLYLHLDSLKVKSGDTVKKGTLVGTVGDSGLANAPHLHLSIKINSTSVDPLQFVSAFK